MYPVKDAFPTKDVEFALVGYTDNDKYRSFNISQADQQDDAQLRQKIGAEIDKLNPSASLYVGPTLITDNFASDPAPMATYQWANHSKSEVSGYKSVYFLKRALADAMIQAINLWQENNEEAQFKLGIEVKAIFSKAHPNQLHPLEKDIPTKRVMFINRILNKIIQSPPSEEDYIHLGSLISAVEWQLFDENHTRDSVHILENIWEFCVHIY